MTTIAAAVFTYGLIALVIVGVSAATRHVHDFATASGRCAVCGRDDEVTS